MFMMLPYRIYYRLYNFHSNPQPSKTYHTFTTQKHEGNIIGKSIHMYHFERNGFILIFT